MCSDKDENMFSVENIVCTNVDRFTTAGKVANNRNVPIQGYVPPVVTHLQASQCKCAFVGGLSIMESSYLTQSQYDNVKNSHCI